METAVGNPIDSSAATDDERRGAILDYVREVLRKESAAVNVVTDRLGESAADAVCSLLHCSGRVAVTGMGKAGLIGQKIAATLSSTGTPAFVLHPVEAIHGDLGMIRSEDVVLALSNSGESTELVRLLPALRKLGCRIIMMTGAPRSRCALIADIVLDIGKHSEACPLGLAPSCSTTAMLALGDALGLAVMRERQFSPRQYAQFHPGGALGRSLMKVEELMRTGVDCPIVSVSGTLADYRTAVSRAPRRAGAASIVDAEGKLAGFLTHGDLFRWMGRVRPPQQQPIAEIMTVNPKCARSGDLVADAIKIMQRHRIDELPVVDDQRRVVGLIDVQDLIAEGFSNFDAV